MNSLLRIMKQWMKGFTKCYISLLYMFFPLFLTYAFSCQGPTLLKLLDFLDLSS